VFFDHCICSSDAGHAHGVSTHVQDVVKLCSFQFVLVCFKYLLMPMNFLLASSGCPCFAIYEFLCIQYILLSATVIDACMKDADELFQTVVGKFGSDDCSTLTKMQ